LLAYNERTVERVFASYVTELLHRCAETTTNLRSKSVHFSLQHCCLFAPDVYGFIMCIINFRST